MPANRAIRIPDAISYEQAGGMMLKGMTVRYLLRRTFKVEQGTTVLIHAAAGGVGLIACQWAAHLGATVIGTVGSKDKAELARANGCHHTILYRDEDFIARVREITGGQLCDVVYDGVGKTTYPGSLDCLRPLGLFVNYGNASGQIEAFDINLLGRKGSLFATRTSTAHYLGQARGVAGRRRRCVRGGGKRRGENSGASTLRAQGCGQGASRFGGPPDYRILGPHSVEGQSAFLGSRTGRALRTIRSDAPPRAKP